VNADSWSKSKWHDEESGEMLHRQARKKEKKSKNPDITKSRRGV
jgi:hypothetical protein